MIEAVGYLYRSLDLRATYLGSSHPSIHGILQLLREIELSRGRRCWPQGISQQYPEGSKNGSSLWEYLPKLDYHSAHSAPMVSSAMCLSAQASKTQRAKSSESTPSPISDKPRCASSRGKKVLKPIICSSAEKKPQQKVQNNVEVWNGPQQKASKKRRGRSLKIVSLGKTNGLVKLSRQRILSAESESGKGQITTIYRHPLLGPLNTNNSWDSISELISEKWLFHSSDNRLFSQNFAGQRRSQIESKLLRTSNHTKGITLME